MRTTIDAILLSLLLNLNTRKQINIRFLSLSFDVFACQDFRKEEMYPYQADFSNVDSDDYFYCGMTKHFFSGKCCQVSDLYQEVTNLYVGIQKSVC